jgi:hypothetical protein
MTMGYVQIAADGANVMNAFAGVPTTIRFSLRGARA